MDAKYIITEQIYSVTPTGMNSSAKTQGVLQKERQKQKPSSTDNPQNLIEKKKIYHPSENFPCKKFPLNRKYLGFYRKKP